MNRLMASLLGLILISGGIGFSISPATAASASRRSFYIYRTDAQKWCALKSYKAFVDEVGRTSQFEDNEFQIWLSGRLPVRLTEFRTDAEAEWFITSTYKLDAAGQVTAVRVAVRSGEPLTDKILNFSVANGAYKPAVPTSLSSEFFRKAGNVTSFPFARLIRRLGDGKGIDKLCDE